MPRRSRSGPCNSFRLVPMLDANSRQLTTQCLLRRAAAGDEAAVDALLRHSCDRLTRLTRRMLGDFRRVRKGVRNVPFSLSSRQNPHTS